MSEIEEDDASAEHVAAEKLLRQVAQLRESNAGLDRRRNVGEHTAGAGVEGEAADNLVIQVAVHVLHNNNVAKVQRHYVDAQMDVLNRAYNASAAECATEPGNVRISFKLEAVSYHNNKIWSE